MSLSWIKTVAFQLPKEDVEAPLCVTSELRFLVQAERGLDEIEQGKSVTLDEFKRALP